MNSAVLACETLSRFGAPVVPIHTGRKNPVWEHWPSKALSDKLSIAETWPSNAGNVGVACGNGLIVIDVDCKNGAKGFEGLASLPPLPDTLTVGTPSSGHHLYFTVPKELKLGNSRGGLPSGIDVRGVGGQVLAPGSVVDGKPYVLLRDVPVAPAPQWLIDLLRAAPVREVNAGNEFGEMDTPEAIDACRRVLERAVDTYEGSRDNTAYQIANKFYDFGVTRETCLELLHDWNDAKCFPPLADDDLDRISASARNSRKASIGRDNPSVGFAPIEHPPTVGRSRAKLVFPNDVSLEDLRQRRESALVEGLVHRGELGVLYGASTTGKSFLALDFAFAIAHGKPWHGMKTSRGPVLYACLEGSGGFQLRMLAHKIHHGDTGRRFAMLPGSVSLVRGRAGDEGVARIVDMARELELVTGEPVAMIIIDTVQRAMAGDDENSTGDMTLFVNRLESIQLKTGAAVLVAHHTNAEGQIRGSRVLFNSAELVLKVERTQKRRKVIAEKVKDGEDGPLFDFELQNVDLGSDGSGHQYEAPVVKRLAHTAGAFDEAKGKVPKLNKKQQVLVECSKAALADGRAVEASGTIRVAATVLEAEFPKRYPVGLGDPDNRERTVQRYWREVCAKPPPGYELIKGEGDVDYFTWPDPRIADFADSSG